MNNTVPLQPIEIINSDLIKDMNEILIGLLLIEGTLSAGISLLDPIISVDDPFIWDITWINQTEITWDARGNSPPEDKKMSEIDKIHLLGGSMPHLPPLVWGMPGPHLGDGVLEGDMAAAH